MTWEPIDFQGIVDLDRKIIDQLERYLVERETRLADQILNVIPTHPQDTFVPVLPRSGSTIKFSEAVEGFSKKVRLFTREHDNQLTPIENDKVVKEINKALWEFTEVLEGCAVELFQQVRQIPIDRWHLSLAAVVPAMKDILVHRIEELMWGIRRLKYPLNEFCKANLKKSKQWRWHLFGKDYVDGGLLDNLRKCEKFVKEKYQAFTKRYHEYTLLNLQIEDHLQKMKSFPVLSLLDGHDQNLYVDIFRLLKMIELNPNPKSEVAIETKRGLKSLASIESVSKVLRTYCDELKDSLFKSSHEWKNLHQGEEDNEEALNRLKVKTKDYQDELRHLMQTMSRYRTFILKSDPNPYVRSRWGFSEWIVGPEPLKAKQLLHLIYDAEALDEAYTQFSGALSKDEATSEETVHEAKKECERLLHEMGQPLISQTMMHHRAERLLEQLKACDEFGSPYNSTIEFVEETISKAMREDWKYHVLHAFPLFHQLFRWHQGMVDGSEDPSHAFRLDRFQQLFDQIEEWVVKDDVYSHVHEIEIDINDMKTYLQDFLAAIQRVDREKSNDPFLDENIHKLRQQLLEYRYVFGQFFYTIASKNSEGQQLRNQFLFVDQYFETAESLLHDLKKSWEGKLERNQ